MSVPVSMEKISQRMQEIQEQAEMSLRPLLATQFRAMADCMEIGGRPG